MTWSIIAELFDARNTNEHMLRVRRRSCVGCHTILSDWLVVGASDWYQLLPEEVVSAMVGSTGMVGRSGVLYMRTTMTGMSWHSAAME